MKNKILLALASFIAVAMAGCSNDTYDEPGAKEENGGTMLRFELRQESMTRGMVTSTSFKEGDRVLIVVADQQYTDEKPFVTGAELKIGKWVMDQNLDFSEPYNGHAWTVATMSVYYPYSIAKESFDESTNEIKLDNLLMQEDILFGGCFGLSKENPTADILCGHVMTCLTFSLQNLSDNSASIDQIIIESNKGKTVGKAGTMKHGVWTSIVYDSTCTLPYYATIPAHETKDINLLLAPTDMAYKTMTQEGIKEDTWHIYMLINGKQVSFDIDFQAWSSGHQYVYPVTLPATLPAREPKKIHMYDTYDGKHVYWADINVGAGSESEYGRLFGWGDPTGTLTSENLDDYPSATPPDNIAGTEYDMVAANWKGNWRLPSNSDIWDLRRCANYTEEWTSVNGVNGVRITSTKTGNSIFFSVAPERVGTTVKPINDGHNIYWLANLNDEDNQKAGVLYFGYNTIWSNPLSFWSAVGTQRYTGLPVRGIWIDD